MGNFNLNNQVQNLSHYEINEIKSVCTEKSINLNATHVFVVVILQCVQYTVVNRNLYSMKYCEVIM